ncbi:MAG: sugar transferase [Flavobacteriales bacterium]|nr:sugar transferase [Flavobacteriales bacterium]
MVVSPTPNPTLAKPITTLARHWATVRYVVGDVLASAMAWTTLYLYRKQELELAPAFLETWFPETMWMDGNFRYGLMFVPMFWLGLYGLAGMHGNPYRRHRSMEVGQVLLTTLLGSLILFFVLILDDAISSYTQYYQSLLVLFAAQSALVIAARLPLTTRTVKRVHRGELAFNTLIVGCNEQAVSTIREIRALRRNPGFRFVGLIQVGQEGCRTLEGIPCLGSTEEMGELIGEHAIEEVILAVRSSEHGELESIISRLEGTGVGIKIIPDIYDILSGMVRMQSLFGAPLIAIRKEMMPAWQVAIKRGMDVVISIIALLILAPLLLTIALAVKLSSKGPVFFHQERVGRWGTPFMIHKFRSMYVGSERNGPQLSSDHDPRITPVGRFLRKSRFDELPQFFNVLIGEMSLVGPRPERQHYIDLISERASHYHHLHKVRPGITSWGQVKYGYAENVEQMVQRLRFDLIYMENMSLALDIKILTYTVWIVLRGRGK